MNEHAKNLRRTRADMLGTDDEGHYWECHAAANEIERLEAALNDACEPIETQPKVGSSIDYANGFRVGAQCQRLHAKSVRIAALEQDDER